MATLAPSRRVDFDGIVGEISTANVQRADDGWMRGDRRRRTSHESREGWVRVGRLRGLAVPFHGRRPAVVRRSATETFRCE